MEEKNPQGILYIQLPYSFVHVMVDVFTVGTHAWPERGIQKFGTGSDDSWEIHGHVASVFP